MYVGESEKNVRDVFAQARAAAPCVLFFDELDSLAPARGRNADSGGVMDRVVAQLLSELDGVSAGDGLDDSGEGEGEGYGVVEGEARSTENKTVFVIGATNRPDLIDPSLLRPGRFDRLLYLGTSGDRETQLKVLRAITRKFTFEHGLDLDDVVRFVPPAFTGADMSAVAAQALRQALKRRVADVDARVEELNARRGGAEESEYGDIYGGGEESSGTRVTPRQVLGAMTPDEVQVRVSLQDLVEACQQVTPSVSAEEIAHYEALRKEFSSV